MNIAKKNTIIKILFILFIGVIFFKAFIFYSNTYPSFTLEPSKNSEQIYTNNDIQVNPYFTEYETWPGLEINRLNNIYLQEQIWSPKIQIGQKLTCKKETDTSLFYIEYYLSDHELPEHFTRRDSYPCDQTIEIQNISVHYMGTSTDSSSLSYNFSFQINETHIQGTIKYHDDNPTKESLNWFKQFIEQTFLF